MIIDCHGHYTTEPKPLGAYRQSQIAGLTDPARAPASAPVKWSETIMLLMLGRAR